MGSALLLGRLYDSGRMAMIVTEAQEPSNYGSTRKRWALTKEAFDSLLVALDADRDSASEKYILVRRNLVRFFEGRGCRFAEDHADEAINRVAKKLEGGEEIHDLNSYSYGVARMLLLEIFKEREREERALNELPALRLVETDPAETEIADERLECLNHCLGRLPRESRMLIISYYQGDNKSRIENRKRLTESLGIPNQALRSRAVRLREKLEGCLATCLKKKRAGTTQNRVFGH
jgi:RNA polymerase sigma factor (sigma-70 family)